MNKELQEIKVTLSRLPDSAIEQFESYLDEIHEEMDFDEDHLGLIKLLIVGYHAAWDTIESQAKELEQLRNMSLANAIGYADTENDIAEQAKELEQKKATIFGLDKEVEYLRNQLREAVEVLELIANGSNHFPALENALDVLIDIRGLARETLSHIQGKGGTHGTGMSNDK